MSYGPCPAFLSCKRWEPRPASAPASKSAMPGQRLMLGLMRWSALCSCGGPSRCTGCRTRPACPPINPKPAIQLQQYDPHYSATPPALPVYAALGAMHVHSALIWQSWCAILLQRTPRAISVLGCHHGLDHTIREKSSTYKANALGASRPGPCSLTLVYSRPRPACVWRRI